MLEKFEEYNKKREDNYANKNIIIASMDIKKWYPNIIAEPSARIVKQMWEDSEVNLEGVDYTEISKYLGKHLTSEDAKKEILEELKQKKQPRQRKQQLRKQDENLPEK